MQQTKTTEERTARMAVLAAAQPDAAYRNLFTLVRHRRLAAVGPWSGTPDGAWSCAELGEGLCLCSADMPFQQCQTLIDQIVASAKLNIDGREILYDLDPMPRRHRAYRDERSPFKDRPFPDSPIPSPFKQHSAEVHEYWSFPGEPDRKEWRTQLEKLRDQQPDQLSHLGCSLDRFSNRLGNLMVAGAEDAVCCALDLRHDRLHHQRVLCLQVDTSDPLPGLYRATVWAKCSGDIVLKREISVNSRLTRINLASDIDHIGFAVYRVSDGECIDYYESHLVKEVKVDARMLGPKVSYQDHRGRIIHEVTRSNSNKVIKVNSSNNNHSLDGEVRRKWLDYRSYEREASARRDSNFVRFQPDEFDQATKHFIELLERHTDRSDLVYICDPYFLDIRTGNVLGSWRLYVDLFTKTSGQEIRILCAKKLNRTIDWWSQFNGVPTSHVTIRSFLRRSENQGESKPAFHDRYLITPNREILITHSLNGWSKSGVTFAALPYGVYRAEAEQLWTYGRGSHEGLIIEEVRR